ncbi:MAG: hypothetical protein ACE5IZ_08480 [Dehalococcoidia bacterium]
MSTIDTGKRGEYLVLAGLLKRGARVYVPVVDAEGIDAIVRRADGSFVELQVKTASMSNKCPRWFQVTNLKPRPNFYILGVSLRDGEIWVIPSLVFAKYATISISKHGAEICDLNLNGGQRKYGAALKDKLAEYCNAWHLITQPTEADSVLNPVEASFAEDWDSEADSVYDII